MSANMTLEEIERLSEGRTPGDWRIAAAGDYVGGGINIDAGAGGYVCLVDGSAESPSKHSRADANLIAAAPRLLEIAQEMRAREAKKDHEIHCLKTAIRESNAALMAEEGTTVTYNLPEGGAAWTILSEICKREIG